MTSHCAVGGADCPGHAHESIVCSGPPLSVALGTLVVHQLNVLALEPCCERCCDPCGVLADLLVTGRLQKVIDMAPPHLAEHAAGVTDEWLRSRWGCQNNPPCEEAS
jgi:hypothetical protein